jgi:hypothetical protein
MLPRPHHCSPGLDALVAAADTALSGELSGELAAAGIATALDGALLHVDGDAPPERCLRWRPLDGAHPLDVLLGFTAPPHWLALGVSSTGKARRLDADDEVPQGARAQPVRITLLIDRSGDARAVMRLDGDVIPLRERPEGTVADACRRALGQPTAPPPSSTLGLWTLAWLDRLVEAAGHASTAPMREWSQVAGLHAAAAPALGRRGAAFDPGALAAAATALAEAWPWPRLRAEPAVVDLPGPPLTSTVAAWMDDGMFARWLLADLPNDADLLAAVHALLPPTLAEGVEVVVRAAGEASWPIGEASR